MDINSSKNNSHKMKKLLDFLKKIKFVPILILVVFVLSLYFTGYYFLGILTFGFSVSLFAFKENYNIKNDLKILGTFIVFFGITYLILASESTYYKVSKTISINDQVKAVTLKTDCNECGVDAAFVVLEKDGISYQFGISVDENIAKQLSKAESRKKNFDFKLKKECSVKPLTSLIRCENRLIIESDNLHNPVLNEEFKLFIFPEKITDFYSEDVREYDESHKIWNYTDPEKYVQKMKNGETDIEFVEPND